MVILRHNLAMTLDHLPTPCTYTRILLQRCPSNETELLQGTGLSAAQVKRQANITVAQQLDIFSNAVKLAKDATWGA